MKKIAILTTNIGNSGGTERVVSFVANNFSKKYDVTVYSMVKTSISTFYELDSKISIRYLNLYQYEHEKRVLFKTIKKVWNTISFFYKLKNIDADIIIGTSKSINIYLSLLSFFFKKKIIGCEHFAHNAPMSKFIKTIRLVAYKRLDRLIVLTLFDYNYYKSKGIKTEIIPNAIPFQINQRPEHRAKIILAVGRHSIQKRFDLLLRIWLKAKLYEHGWQLKIIGDGELFDRNKSLAIDLGIAESVFFEPPTKDIVDEYLNASFFVMTSEYEALPMVLIESMYCGLPCIAFDCDTGPRDIIEDNVDGFIVPFGNIELFSQKMIWLSNNDVILKEMSTSAVLNISRFSAQTIYEKWNGLIRHIYE